MNQPEFVLLWIAGTEKRLTDGPKVRSGRVDTVEFEADLGQEAGGIRSFASLEAAQAWVDEENARWDWARSLPPERRQGAIDHALTALRSGKKLIDRSVQLSGTPEAGVGAQAAATADRLREVETSINQAREQLRRAFARHRLPVGGSQAGKRIDALVTAGSLSEAAGYLYARLGLSDTPVFPNLHGGPDLGMLRGMMWASIEHATDGSPLSEAYAAAAQALVELHSSNAKFLGMANDQVSEATSRVEAVKGQFERLLASQESVFKQAMSSQKSNFDGQLAIHRETLEGLEATFKEKLALRAPATYWRTRMFRHTWGSIAGGILTVIAIAAVVVGLLLHSGSIAPPKGADGLPDVWRLGTLVLAGLFTVWLVRLIVRVFLSQLHLAQDAAERATMVTTYLSLREGGTLSDDDRKLILQTLFRPASDGIVKDEGLPPSFHEIFTRTK